VYNVNFHPDTKVRDRNMQVHFTFEPYSLESQNQILLPVTTRLKSKISLRLIHGS